MALDTLSFVFTAFLWQVWYPGQWGEVQRPLSLEELDGCDELGLQLHPHHLSSHIRLHTRGIQSLGWSHNPQTSNGLVCQQCYSLVRITGVSRHLSHWLVQSQLFSQTL